MPPTENPNNIRMICADCAEKESKTFTKEQICISSHVKKRFKSTQIIDGEELYERMWVTVEDVTHDSIIGVIDNDPILQGIPQCGTRVHVKFTEVIDTYGA